MAGRPKEIYPKGDIKRLVALVPVPVTERIVREAKRTGVSVTQLVREKLEKVSK